MKPQLLIVDDEPDIRNSLSRRYTLNGYDVDTAEDGESALGFLEKKPYHVVVSDIKMPGMDGIELLRTIRSEYPMTRVIIITGYVTLDNGLACLRYGAETCIFKPIEDLSEMDEAIKKVLESLQHWEQKLLRLKQMVSENGAA